ncbi:unnamed protein product, partial [Prorocentrum cordatum]
QAFENSCWGKRILDFGVGSNSSVTLKPEYCHHHRDRRLSPSCLLGGTNPLVTPTGTTARLRQEARLVGGPPRPRRTPTHGPSSPRAGAALRPEGGALLHQRELHAGLVGRVGAGWLYTGQVEIACLTKVHVEHKDAEPQWLSSQASAKEEGGRGGGQQAAGGTGEKDATERLAQSTLQDCQSVPMAALA